MSFSPNSYDLPASSWPGDQSGGDPRRGTQEGDASRGGDGGVPDVHVVHESATGPVNVHTLVRHSPCHSPTRTPRTIRVCTSRPSSDGIVPLAPNSSTPPRRPSPASTQPGHTKTYRTQPCSAPPARTAERRRRCVSENGGAACRRSSFSAPPRGSHGAEGPACDRVCTASRSLSPGRNSAGRATCAGRRPEGVA